MATLLTLGDYKVESVVEYNKVFNALNYSLYVTHTLSKKRRVLSKEYIKENSNLGNTNLEGMFDCLGLADNGLIATFLSTNHTLVKSLYILQRAYIQKYNPNLKLNKSAIEECSMYEVIASSMEAEIIKESELIRLEK